MLKNISSIIQNSVRKDDSICRWGGEEILILLPDTNIYAAEMVAEKLRKKIEDFTLIIGEKEIKATITAGVCSANDGTTIIDLINCADMCMYKGKTTGKNCVVTSKNN